VQNSKAKTGKAPLIYPFTKDVCTSVICTEMILKPSKNFGYSCLIQDKKRLYVAVILQKREDCKISLRNMKTRIAIICLFTVFFATIRHFLSET
jgi:predicted nucleic acid binding AN1-type Zn finger protein